MYIHETYLGVVTLISNVSTRPYGKSNSGSSTDQNLRIKSVTEQEIALKCLHKEIGRDVERDTNPELHFGKYLGYRLKVIQ